MSTEKILIVEDEPHISGLLKYNLERANYECLIANTGEEGLVIANKQPVNLIILDIMLPEMDGLEFCRKIKKDRKLSSIPVVMLTAKGEEIDRIIGLELGVDDYIVKPFSTRELVLRIKAILSRGNPKKAVPEELLIAEKLKVDIQKHKVTVNEKKIDLTYMEFNLLVTLMQKRGMVQSRDHLLDKIWGIDGDVTTRTVDTHIKRLRKKLGETGALIKTVRGMGYSFKDDDED